MGWNYEKAKARVDKNDFADEEVEVKDLSRTMDFHNLARKDVRRAQGVHLYVDMPGFHRAVEEAGDDLQKQRKLIRAASVLRKVQRDLMDEHDIGDIQRQTVRLHALQFKPYDAEKEEKSGKRSEQTVIHAITHNTYVEDVFSEAFDSGHYDCACGLSGGTSYIANIGKGGRRELISLGSCANLAAKILLEEKQSICITDDVYSGLPECLKEHFKKDRQVAGNQVYKASKLKWSTHPELAKELGVKWDKDKWKKKTEDYKAELPLSDIEITDANARIDVDSLTEKKCKRTQAIAYYADLDGFTKYVRTAEEEDKKAKNDNKMISLVRQFHMIRTELHSVSETDYEGIVLQHRGDCLLGISHLPSGAEEKSARCDEAVDLAIGMQSSMIDVINPKLDDRKDIHLVVGMDIGKTIVTRVGKKGRRVSLCFGPKVNNAEAFQRKTKAKGICISSAMYDSLTNKSVKKQFKKDDADDTYTAIGLTRRTIDIEEESKAASAGAIGAVVENSRIVVDTSGRSNQGNTKPWSG